MTPSLPCRFALAATLLFTGCATLTKEQLATVRAAQVSPVVLHKLEHGGSLAPADLIELKRRHVDDSVAIRQLDRAGVDDFFEQADVKALKNARVSDAVIHAAVRASNRLAGRFYDPYFDYGFGWYPYYGPWGYLFRPYPGFAYGPYGPRFGRPHPYR